MRRGAEGEPEEISLTQSLAKVDDVDAYDYDFRLNTSLVYKHRNDLDFRFYIQNLFGANNNKRYSVDSGVTKDSPNKVRFVEEPRAIGVRLDYRI